MSETVAPPANPPTLLAIAAARHATLAELLARAAAGYSADDVHDLRVATRRLGEVVRLLAPVTHGAMLDAAATALRDVRRAAGDLRDLDVLAEHLAKARLPRPLRRVATDMTAEFHSRRAELLARLVTSTQAASVSGTMLYLARVMEEQSARAEAAQTALAGGLKKTLQQRQKKLRQALGRAARKQTAAALHAARIAVKKLRYALELAAESKLERRHDRLAQLKRIQKLLGEHHDVHVITETLASHLPQGRGSVADRSALVRLRAAWRKFLRQTNRRQARRAAAFFALSYRWNNS